VGRVKGVLFDCFGTLFYNESGLTPFQKLQKLLGDFKKENFLEFVERVRTRGEDLEKALRDFLGKEGKKNLLGKALRIMRQKNERMLAYPETFEVIEKLKEKGIKVGIVSNTYRESFERVRKAYPVEKIFDAVVLSYEVKCAKPSPEIFRIAAEKLGLRPEEVLFVGDTTETDYEGAKRAGMQAVLLDREGKHEEVRERVRNLREILKLF